MAEFDEVSLKMGEMMADIRTIIVGVQNINTKLETITIDVTKAHSRIDEVAGPANDSERITRDKLKGAIDGSTDWLSTKKKALFAMVGIGGAAGTAGFAGGVVSKTILSVIGGIFGFGSGAGD